jgi:hypothetical protein
MATKVSRGGIEYDVPEGEEDFVQKLQDWADREKAEEGLLDVKFFPRLPEDPPITLNNACKAAYRVLSGEAPSWPLDTTNL